VGMLVMALLQCTLWFKILAGDQFYLIHQLEKRR